METAPDNLEMALNPTTAVAVESLDMVQDNSNSTAATEAKAEAVTSSSPLWTVDTFGTFPKKRRSKRPRFENPSTVEEYLAEGLFLLARSKCRCGSVSSNASNSVNAAPTSAPIKNQKKTEFIETQNRSHRCTVCDKLFTTYQALGGHKTSHRNKPTKNNVLLTLDNPDSVSSLKPSGRAHVCSVCYKSFNTGQALGGHKRLHYERQINNTSGSGGSGVSSDTSREQDMVHREDLFLEKKRVGDVIVHGFDLNLPSQSEPEPELEVGSKVDSKVYGDHEVDQGRLPMKKRRLAINLELRLSLTQD